MSTDRLRDLFRLSCVDMVNIIALVEMTCFWSAEVEVGSSEARVHVPDKPYS